MNENQPIQKSYNGSELPHKLGNYLCHLLIREGVSKANFKYCDKFILIYEEEKKKKKKGRGNKQKEEWRGDRTI